MDPTGHQCVGEPEECLEDDGTTGPGFPGTGGTVSNPGAGNCSGTSCHGNDDSDYGDGYSGLLPSDIQSILLSHGANPELLASVTIYVTTEEAASVCGSNLAVTVNSNIYICTIADINGDVVYDPNNPTPVLLHELVHVRQFRDNWVGTWIEVAINNVKKHIDKNYNPYKESWVEIEGAACQTAYKANPNISLDSGACNLK